MQVAPGATFEAVADLGTTGLAAGVRVIDNAGATTIARVTAGVAEYPAASGIYAKTLTAPTTAGQYTILWDTGTQTAGNFAPEDLLVSWSTAAVVAPSGRDLCSLTDVTMLTPGYTAGDDAQTDATLQTLITEQSRDAMERCRREFVAIESVQPATRLFDVTSAQMRTRKLPIGDATSISTVSLLDGLAAVVQTLTVTSEYVLLPRVREDWQPYGTIRFVNATPLGWPVWNWGPPGTVQVTGTWGFPQIPATVKDAVARLVLLRYLNDVTAAGTDLANDLNRAELNFGAWWRQALDALDRFAIPTI